MLKPARVLGCCLLIVPLIGSAPKRSEQTKLSSAKFVSRKTVQEQNRLAGKLFREGRCLEARDRFVEIRNTALRSGYLDLAARAIGNHGGCEFALHHYRTALKLLLEAHQLARKAGDAGAAAALDANIGSLYAQVGELDAAVQWLQVGIERLQGKDRAEHLAEAQIEMASLRARQGRWEQASTLFRSGIDGADRAGNTALLAKGFQRLGEEHLRSHDLVAAEQALLEAYRLRTLGRLPLDGSYCYLGKLRLEQGDYISASALLDHALEAAGKATSTLPLWDIYLTRGRVRLAQGRLEDALTDLRVARRLAQAWRWSMPADDASGIGAESGALTQVYDTLIEAGNRSFLERRDPALIRETFEAAEENRGSSLRALVHSSRATEAELPQEYWTAVSRLQRAELTGLRDPGEAAQQERSAARADLVRMDAAFVTTVETLPQDLEPRVQANLGDDTVLLAFHLGKRSSWLWALDQKRLAVYPLPPADQIGREAQALAEAVRRDSPTIRREGARLFNTLFGAVDRRFLEKSRWLLALDGELFGTPFSVLVDKKAGGNTFLVETHVIEVIPGAGYWLDRRLRPAAPNSPILLGVGDPIYNLADSRNPRRSAPGLFPAWLPTATARPAVVLPRLVASNAELDECARAWHGETVVLTGAGASRRSLQAALSANPAVLHFATHVLKSTGQPPAGLIALSLTGDGEPELLSSDEVSRWHLQANLVVLSGCRSAGGGALPGTGLLGLTRAFLMAGAGSVIGSQWDMPDQDGALFSAFYRNLRAQARPDAALALRNAQLLMLRGGGFRARPAYWGAYFLMGSK